MCAYTLLAAFVDNIKVSKQKYERVQNFSLLTTRKLCVFYDKSKARFSSVCSKVLVQLEVFHVAFEASIVYGRLEIYYRILIGPVSFFLQKAGAEPEKS